MVHLNEDELNFSDPEDYVDDVEDYELIGDLLKTKPREIHGYDSIIAVDNCPKVGEDRYEKLKGVLLKMFSKIGVIINHDFPRESDTGMTKGYIFFEYENQEDAASAVQRLNKYSMDKHHTLLVNFISDIDKYASVPDDWEPPAPQPFKETGNLYEWLTEPHAYDQYSVIYEGGKQTAIYFNTPTEPNLVKERNNWTETEIRWSPNGTYFATFHSKGIALWGGVKFEQIQKFAHCNVQLINFSPCERYLVTYSNSLMNDSDEDLIIWDIVTGQKKRGFQCSNASFWPIFKWNFDGSYFARVQEDLLQVYETPYFGLLERKSQKIPGIADFEWSPTDNYISYWTPETKDNPARVVLMEIPSKQHLCTKNLFTVADCKIYWQKSGDYLCVKVDRYKARRLEGKEYKYSGIFHNLNILRLREKEIPVDTIEIKEPIKAFAWEPIGTRFAFIHGEQPRSCASFYNVNKKGFELIKTLDKKAANMIVWSPLGQFVVLAGLRTTGVLEFIDTTDMTVMAQVEHYMATDVEWDPSGRYLTSAVSFWSSASDNAFWIWNFQGKLLQKHSLEKFCQFFWRPRPKCILNAEQLKEIKKNMKKYSNKFAIEDKARESKASKEILEQRKNAMNIWNKFCNDAEKKFNDELFLRNELRGLEDNDKPEEFLEETIEFLVKVEEFILKNVTE